MSVVIAWSFLLGLVVAGLSLVAAQIASSSAVRVPVRVLSDVRASRRRALTRRGGR